MKGPVLVAMSGGVDSSVVAALLKRRGCKVIGVTMQIWQENQRDPRHSGCCSLGAVEDARRVAHMLDIPHYVVNYKTLFRETVIEDFVSEYAAGRTPNPCVRCNREVKFDALIGQMREIGAAALATGHYARIRRGPGRSRLMRARGTEKDQSYVLYMLAGSQLEPLRFPLGDLPDKAETRRIAAELGLPVAGKPDSQEICFVGEAGGYREFLQRERPDLLRRGAIVDREGRELGEHGGVATLTVGQRRGVGVSSRDGRPLYVLELRPEQNLAVVGHEEELLQTEVRIRDVVWHEEVRRPIRVAAKIRYNMEAKPATLDPDGTLRFAQPVRAVAPGQIAVAYRGATVVAGGTIV